MERTLIKTEDGSHSLYVKELNEHYHSIHGAIQESQHVFINAGLKHITSPLNEEKNFSNQLHILEIGLGTGLNALLSFLETEQSSIQLNYTALEAFPVSADLVKELNYVACLNKERLGHTLDAELLSASGLQNFFEDIHTCEWETEIVLSKNFKIHKIKKTLQEIKFENIFDLIYFDAFGPPVQPEMWTEEMFIKIHNATKPNGILVTYCAKGEVKRTLKKAGFTIESLPGPPGKREMVRARKN